MGHPFLNQLEPFWDKLYSAGLVAYGLAPVPLDTKAFWLVTPTRRTHDWHIMREAVRRCVIGCYVKDP